MFGPMNLIGGSRAASVADLVADKAALGEQQRSARISTAWARYWGDHPKPLKPSSLDPAGADNTIVNMARKTVDVSAFYLFGIGAGVTFNVDDGQTTEDGDKSAAAMAAEQWLTDCWAAQDGGKAQLLIEFATAGGVTGDGFLRVLMPDKSIGELFPQIIDLDAANVTATCEPSNYRRVRQYRLQSTAMNPGTGKPVVYRTLIDRVNAGAKMGWDITEQESRGDNAPFVTISGPDRWPYEWCPVFHTKNRPAPLDFHGTSDLEDDVLAINSAITFVVSNINRILRAHGHPLTYITGANVNDMDRAVGSILKLHNENAKVENVEMISDLASSFSQLEKLRDAYHELTSIPEVVSGKLESVGQLSGLAMQILYAPLTTLTTTKRLLYGERLVKLAESLLEIGGHPDMTVTLTWPSLIPSDPQAEAATALAKQQAGVSKSTTVKELGYDPEDEADKRQGEAKADMETQARAFNAGTGPQDDPTKTKGAEGDDE